MTVEVHVVTPQREVWSGEAEMVIAHGVDGEVGILAGHAPLLIRLSVWQLRILLDSGETLRAVVDGGFMHVSPGEEGTRVDVMATDAELRSEIDVEAARRLAQELAGAEDEESRQALERAEARLSLSASDPV